MNTRALRSRGAPCLLACGIMALVAAWAPAVNAAAETTPAPCDACHGAHGEGMAAAHVPRIAGQSAEYLKKQLDDYANGSRDNAVMRNFAKALSDRQRTELAAHYAAMSAVANPQTGDMPTIALNADQLARGHRLAYQGDELSRVQACNSCHGPDGVGVLHAAPYLGGQSADYLASALKSFQQGTRKNDAGELMRSVAKQLSEADVTAISGYYAQVNSSPK